jgi:hypothetical protein
MRCDEMKMCMYVEYRYVADIQTLVGDVSFRWSNVVLENDNQSVGQFGSLFLF